MNGIPEESCFLGVGSSANKRRWLGLNEACDRASLALAQEHDLPPMLARTLARLGVSGADVPGFLAPSLRELMPDPSILRDMDKATKRIAQAISTQENIAIFADYDVDGAASGALLVNYFAQLGLTATIYVPDRLREGYGPNEAAMRKLAKEHSLIICVDCGTLAFAPIEAARPADVIVLDHHQGGQEQPDCLALVNPNRKDEPGDLHYLCAAGVVFLALAGLNRLLRKAGQKTPDLMGMLDLVALATVADVAPLIGFNRALVRQGLKIMAQRRQVGLRALCDVAQLSKTPAAYHLGFVLGPRINAGGRIGAADLGLRLLTCQDADEASALAERLEELNLERRAIEQQVTLQALEQAETRGFDQALVWAAGAGWHPGVVGIVAARLKEASNRPAVVIGFDGEDGKGSGRSLPGIDLGASVAQCTAEGLFSAGGGHKMAAGLSLERNKLEPAMARLSQLLAAQGADAIAPRDLHIDGLISPEALSFDLIQKLEMAGPFGAGAPAPRFAMAVQRVAFVQPVGEAHLRLTFQDADGSRLDAIAFNALQNPMGALLRDHAGRRFHIAGQLEIDHWKGRRKLKMRLEDVALSGES